MPIAILVSLGTVSNIGLRSGPGIEIEPRSLSEYQSMLRSAPLPSANPIWFQNVAQCSTPSNLIVILPRSLAMFGLLAMPQVGFAGAGLAGAVSDPVATGAGVGVVGAAGLSAGLLGDLSLQLWRLRALAPIKST